MDDRDLELIRGFRLHEATPRDGMQQRIEEDLWQAILAEEAAAARPRRSPAGSPRAWFGSMLRPAVAAGAAGAIALVVALASSTGVGTGNDLVGTTGLTQANAGLLDGAVANLFGHARPGSGSMAMSGAMELPAIEPSDSAFASGPVRQAGGSLDDASIAVVAEASRDPRRLRERLRETARTVAGDDDSDTVAFHIAMRWVVDDQVPTDLRAALLRALEGMTGLDAALVGRDLLGREGLLLGHLDLQTGMRHQYLLDADDGGLLERRGFTTSYVDPACPPGTITDHALYDDAGDEVRPADTPWLAWPAVIAACTPRTGDA